MCKRAGLKRLTKNDVAREAIYEIGAERDVYAASSSNCFGDVSYLIALLVILIEAA